MTEAPRIAIVGAGPAGLAAARRMVAEGLRPTILDEAARPGGQGTRRLSGEIAAQHSQLFGRAARSMKAREADEDAVLSRCDYRSDTLVWACHGGRLELLGPRGYDSLPYTHLLLATGATDRVMPVPGWTLPGVFTLGGAQVALKRHASFIGGRVILAGSSPLLYLAAAQYLRLGHPDLTILDTTSLRSKMVSFPAMMRHAPGIAMQGLSLLRELRRGGVRMAFGVGLVSIEGAERVEALHYVSGTGQALRCPADAVALGHGLRPELQLAELAGAEFTYDARHRQYFPRIDATGQAADRLWIAGDGARTAGAEAADAAGELAAEGILAALGRPAGDALRLRHLQRRLAAHRRFQDAMTGTFAWPADAVADLPDDAILCRCERVRAGEIRAALATDLAPTGINRVKSVTRCGMGRCQGRFCGPALAELVAHETGALPGRLRAQAPVRPIPLICDAGAAR